MRFYLIIFLLPITFSSKAQNPYTNFTESIDIRYGQRQPVISYVIRVDTAQPSFISMEMKLRNVADSFRIALFVHPEYDDRFYRFIEDLHVEGGTIRRSGNTLWEVHTTVHETTIHYKIHLPQERNPRAAWRPFLCSTGGLLGGPQCYFYVVGATLAPAYVHLQIPEGWQIATSLQSTLDPSSFFAPTAAVLFDSPILIGKLKAWNFQVNDVPHKIVYWPSDHPKTFDTLQLVSSIQKLVIEADQLFGRLPYKDYSFLIQDGAYGALEHANSVTLGITSEELADEMNDYLLEIAHEYFHAWNIVRIRPAEYGDVSYLKPALSKGLWWSEGLTMFYADVLLRRAGISTSTRIEHLQRLIEAYFNNAGNHQLSAEKVSMAAYALPGFSGNYDGSTHLQGELIGTLLDIFIRDATNGEKSMDDIMLKMMERFSSKKGFTGADIENIIGEVCKKNIHPFFETHIRGSKTIDFNGYLALIGLKSEVQWMDAQSEDGKVLPDRRAYAYQLPDQKPVLVGITDPRSCWGKAGLCTGDQVISVNDSLINTPGQFYMAIRSAQIGDRLRMLIKRKGQSIAINILVGRYRTALVSIRTIGHADSKQKRLFELWQNAGQHTRQ